MTTLNSALNFNFASQEAARLAHAERGAEEAVAAQLRQATLDANQFKVGSTITARYQYKVAEDGSLVPLQTQITHDIADDRQGDTTGRRSPRQYRERERQPTFSDLLFPKPQLSPTDEIALFASPATTGQAQPREALPPVAYSSNINTPITEVAEAVDEDGTPIQAELLTPPPANQNIYNFSARAQYSVASLYARNNDVIYNVTPISMLAA